MNQDCYLWTNPDSLRAKLLKTKYFPNNILMDTHSTKNSSHIWKAFQIGGKLLFKGMRWLVGDECLINVWNDN